MKTFVEKSDTEIKSDVLSQLKYEPTVKVTDIGVLVKDGVVTLNGYATGFGEKWHAVSATKRVAGVKAIADDIEVKLPGSLLRTDGDIATAAVNLINWSTSLAPGTAVVTVRDGWITLQGEVSSWSEKNAAEKAVRHLAGVTGVTNLVTIKPAVTSTHIASEIESAFERIAILDASKITVESSGSAVTLRGKVRNYTEREEAERVAYAAEGVHAVDNQLNVEWFGGFDE